MGRLNDIESHGTAWNHLGNENSLESKVWTLESSNVQMLGKSGWSGKGDQKGVATEIDAETRWQSLRSQVPISELWTELSFSNSNVEAIMR